MDYKNLTDFLKSKSSQREIKVSFSEIERLVGTLPKESEYRDWWNKTNTIQADLWLSAGYTITKVIPEYYIVFRRIDAENNKIFIEETNQTIKKQETLYTNKPESLKINVILILSLLLSISLIVYAIFCNGV